jgi:hypothetical protein
MPQATTNYFNSKKLLNLLDILTERLKKEGLNPEYVDQLRVLLDLLQRHQSTISQHNKMFAGTRGYPLLVTTAQKRLINTLQ